MNTSTRRRPVRACASALAAVGVLGFLGGCGGSDGGGEGGGDAGRGRDVASIDDGGGGSRGSGEDNREDGGREEEAGRPQIRVDGTEEEERRIWQAYWSCLKQQGVPTVDKGPTGAEKDYPAEYKACASKEPLLPPETDPERNPDYQDDFRAWVTCMNDKGLKVNALADGAGWNFADPDRAGTPSAEKIVRECKAEAFGGGE